MTELNKWGITDGAADLRGLKAPTIVPYRVAQVDADFIAYQGGFAPGADTYEQQQNACEFIVKKLTRMAGASSCIMHLTPEASNKAGRYEKSLFFPYQGKRSTSEKPEYLEDLRQWMGTQRNGRLHHTCEADDGMAIEQNKAIDAGNAELSIICSKDKDLRMVSGYHMDWVTGDIRLVSGYGSLFVDKTGSTPKIKGFGTSWFWAQMLMGDSADSITGLPKLTGDILNGLKPTLAITDAKSIIADKGASPKQIAAARSKLLSRKAGLCGQIAAYDVISKCLDDRQAFQTVRHCYKRYNEEFKPVNFRDQKPITWQEHFMSEAYMLWMQRYDNRPSDFLDFVKERCI